jgi:hypothetical protein
MGFPRSCACIRPHAEQYYKVGSVRPIMLVIHRPDLWLKSEGQNMREGKHKAAARLDMPREAKAEFICCSSPKGS